MDFKIREVHLTYIYHKNLKTWQIANSSKKALK